MDATVTGVAALIFSGVFNGSFTYPMKLVRKWQWENIWLLFGFLGLVVLPLLIAFWTAPRLLDVYAAVPGSKLATAALLGLAWGVGSLLFGLAISALGISLGYAIIMGTTAIFGTLVPALILEPEILATGRGVRLLASLAAIVLGLVLCALAGLRRDRTTAASPELLTFRVLSRTKFRQGVLLSLLSGLLSASFNIGFALTAEIATTAERFGAAPSNSSFAIWAVIMSAGFVPSLLYCSYSFQRHHSLALFRLEPMNWVYGAGMSVMWILSVKFYGMGANYIGRRGATIGWPILMSVTIGSASILGFMAGEWKGTPRSVRAGVYSGLAALLGAILLASSAGR